MSRRRTAAAPARDLDDFDAPGDMDDLSRQLWASTGRRLSYDAAVRYAERLRRRGAADADARVGLAELPTGWAIAPAGAQVETGRLPFEAVAFAGRVVVLNTGYYPGEPQPLTVIDPRPGVPAVARVRTLPVGALYPAARVAERSAGGDGALYVSGGDDRAVWRVDTAFAARKLAVGGYAAGLAPLDARVFGPGRLAVAYLVAADSTGAAGAGRLAVLNTASGRVEQELPAGHYPTAVESVGDRVYVVGTGEQSLRVFARRGRTHQLAAFRTLAVGRSPAGTCRWGEGPGARLLVVNSGSDDLSVVDLARDSVVGTIPVRFRDPAAAGAERPRAGAVLRAGGAPTSCAVVGARLYVTLATANAVAVYDTARVAAGDPAPLGYLPAGWYPTRVVAAGDSLYVLSAKGVRPRRPNPDGPQPDSLTPGGPGYVLTELRGSLGVLPRAAVDTGLRAWTRRVRAGSPLAAPAAGVALPIRHVFYVVRENRSYDQVLGDLGRGDGDSTLTLFGADVTPAAHALARDFVDLDHFFADGEISVLGHSYATSGYASPLLEWLGNASYSGRFAGYPFGTAPAVFSPAYLWDALDARGVDYRVYGEPYYASTAFWRLVVSRYGEGSALARAVVAQSGRLTTARDRGAALHAVLAPAAARGRTRAGALALLADTGFARGLSRALVGGDALARALAADPALRLDVAEFLSHYGFAYPTWDLGYSDLRRVADWKAEFDADAAAGRVPAFTYLWLPNDHTAGVTRGQLSPRQLVAQNDAALARLVETIAASPVWGESLVLVEEDDAQNGPDHVDATRTVALAAGPFVRRGAVVPDRYDQLSMLRTAEVLLGLDPLGVGDALAVPMLGALSPAADARRWRAPAPSAWLTKDDRARYDSLGAAIRVSGAVLAPDAQPRPAAIPAPARSTPVTTPSP